jgi:diguanylate cyclase (GGDEF)-like protein
MKSLPAPARIYVVAVIASAAVLSIAGVLTSPPRLEMVPPALLLVIGATVAQQFKVKSPKHQSYFTSTIFFFASALLLRPAFVVGVVLISHLVESTRVKYRWYIQAFNISNFIMCGVLAHWVFAGFQSSPAPHGFEALLKVIEAGTTFVAINHLLTALVIMWARRIPITRAGTLNWDNIGTDVALIAIGAIGSLLFLVDPWLVPLCAGPLFLVYRSLLVPTLLEEARSDPKTELANMKHWNQVAEVEIDRAIRFRRPLAVMLADLDLLREVNNKHGHLAGDQLIRKVADAIKGALRDYDLPARFGGDEFAVLMPETNLTEAVAVAERIRRAVEGLNFRGTDEVVIPVTLSVGVAHLSRSERTAAALLAAADRAVYQAKALGRNQVATLRTMENESPRGPRVIASGR